MVGVQNPEQAVAQLEKEIGKRISPLLTCTVDVHETGGKKVLRVLVPRGDDPPYAVDDNKIYVRDEAESGLAVRDEIVGLVLRGQLGQPVVVPSLETPVEKPFEAPAEQAVVTGEAPADQPPGTGVEVVGKEERDGSAYYTMRDLRNGMVVKNVTRSSARRLWHYAITEFAKLPDDLSQIPIQWSGNLGLVRQHKQGNNRRYDLVQRTEQGYRFYYGVTDDGIRGGWKHLVGAEDERE